MGPCMGVPRISLGVGEDAGVVTGTAGVDALQLPAPLVKADHRMETAARNYF